MALDRSWYNTLVDDDGSGLTGSIWDKADVNSLMNAIDSELARVNSVGVFTPRIDSSAGGSSVASLAAGMYVKCGRLVYVSGRITLSSKGSLAAAGAVLLAGLPFQTANSPAVGQGGIGIGYFLGVATPVTGLFTYTEVGAAYAVLTYGIPGGAGQNGTLVVSGINANLDLIFGGCYMSLT